MKTFANGIYSKFKHLPLTNATFMVVIRYKAVPKNVTLEFMR